MRFLEDFGPGTVAEAGRYPVSREAIVAFATAYDPQPFHLDDEAGRASILGGLAASGWHTCAIGMRLIADHVIDDAAALGAPGISEVKWLHPVRSGDVLRLRWTVVSVRPSASRPGKGLVEFRFELLDVPGTVVMTQKNVIFFARRGAVERTADAAPASSAPVPKAAIPAVPESEDASLPFFEDVTVGDSVVFGAQTFTRAAIVAFARAYDPQPFHLDEAAAKAGPFGALAASGWQTAAFWMRSCIDWRTRAAARMRAGGQAVPEIGPSPGFEDLRWHHPVFAGDTVRYGATVLSARPSRSRPDWGLVSHRCMGHNQEGRLVFEFRSLSFLQRRARPA